jgi:hypothetical protein
MCTRTGHVAEAAWWAGVDVPIVAEDTVQGKAGSPAKHANALTPRRDRSHVRLARRIDRVNVDVVLVCGHVGEDGHVVALARPGVPVGVCQWGPGPQNDVDADINCARRRVRQAQPLTVGIYRLDGRVARIDTRAHSTRTHSIRSHSTRLGLTMRTAPRVRIESRDQAGSTAPHRAVFPHCSPPSSSRSRLR